MRGFVDACVRIFPEGKLSLSRAVLELLELGYSGGAFSGASEMEKDKVSTFLEKRGISFEIATSCCFKEEIPSDAKRRIDRERRRVDLILVEPLSESLARRLSQDRRIDVIIANRYVDEVTVRFSTQNNIMIGFELRKFLNSSGASRARLLDSWFRIVKYLDKNDALPVLFTGATSSFELRRPRDLVSLGTILGYSVGECKRMISEIIWDRIELNRFKKSDRYLHEGAWLVDEW